ncbi:hypothetical protein FPE01S_02_02650 [Flavihumibacter petaseus NBRC 106054]|uniref:Uncharacterized protein n=1 Tax=Flavihumibacter petaseus NBRC 106054 TaxID=1220578 RepID=A0A0E9N0J4_9BACT|nr:hypothetical protein FPE01S_02_02650 [Flavihumibacter petaseus NBRC 106054]
MDAASIAISKLLRGAHNLLSTPQEFSRIQPAITKRTFAIFQPQAGKLSGVKPSVCCIAISSIVCKFFAALPLSVLCVKTKTPCVKPVKLTLVSLSR